MARKKQSVAQVEDVAPEVEATEAAPNGVVPVSVQNLCTAGRPGRRSVKKG
jgi:hypothetical protein